MKYKHTLLLIIISLILTNCKDDIKKSYSINGQIQGDYNDYIFLGYNDNDQIDSVKIVNNAFEFKGKVNIPVEAYFMPANPKLREDVSIIPFMLENSEILVKLSYSEIQSSGRIKKSLKMDSINGSKSQELKMSFGSKLRNAINKQSNDSIKEIITYNHLQEFIKVNPKSSLGGQQLAFYSDYFDYSSSQIECLYKPLDKNYQSKRDLIIIESVINRRKKIDIGKIPPRIILPNQNGELIDNESLKGKFVLLEFWASWCGPCRKTNPELTNVYNSFKNKGFEIFGISQDKDIENWKIAFKEDKLEWIQVIDSLNTVGDKYYITTIPFNLLLNREGKIVAKNIKPSKLYNFLTNKLDN